MLIKCFHDDIPVLLVAVEFVMETFDWRPTKFYFWLRKNVVENLVLLMTTVTTDYWFKNGVPRWWQNMEKVKSVDVENS